jgi:hypothetical protein
MRLIGVLEIDPFRDAFSSDSPPYDHVRTDADRKERKKLPLNRATGAPNEEKARLRSMARTLRYRL